MKQLDCINLKTSFADKSKGSLLLFLRFLIIRKKFLLAEKAIKGVKSSQISPKNFEKLPEKTLRGTRLDLIVFLDRKDLDRRP